MTEPIFWLGVSLLLVAVSLTAVLVAAVPAFRELARAARSAEKLFDILSRELPPTLESIRLTGLEITDLTEDVSEGVQSAGRVVKQVDQSLVEVAQQAKRAQSTTRSLWAGVKAAWKTLSRPSTPRRVPERYSSKIKRSSSINSAPEPYESWQDVVHYPPEHHASNPAEHKTYPPSHNAEDVLSSKPDLTYKTGEDTAAALVEEHNPSADS